MAEMSCYALLVPAPSKPSIWLQALGVQLRTLRAARWPSQEEFIVASNRDGFRITKHIVRTIEKCRHANTRAYELFATALGYTLEARVVIEPPVEPEVGMSKLSGGWSPLMHYIQVIPPEDHAEVIALLEDWRVARRRHQNGQNGGFGRPLA